MHESAAQTLAEAANGLGTFGPWANLAATVVMTLVFVWILTKRDPEERKSQLEEMSKARADYQLSLAAILTELAAERKSREVTTDKFMGMITENRERSHEQRMEDRKVYQDSTRTMLTEFLGAIQEMKNGSV